MKYLIFLAMALLLGCGSGTMQITYNEVDDKTMQAFDDIAIGMHRDGFAVWDDIEGTCQIYMLSMEEYRSVAQYHEVLGHETRHCFFGSFH